MISRGLAYIGVAVLCAPVFSGSATAATITAVELWPAVQGGQFEALHEDWSQGPQARRQIDDLLSFGHDEEGEASWITEHIDVSPTEPRFPDGFPAGQRVFSPRDTTGALIPRARWFDGFSQPTQQFAPVPLPGSSRLLGGATVALLLVGWFGRRRGQKVCV